jgi:CHAD domain-containing protein
MRAFWIIPDFPALRILAKGRRILAQPRYARPSMENAEPGRRGAAILGEFSSVFVMCPCASTVPSALDPETAVITCHLHRLYLDRAHDYRQELHACRHGLSGRTVHQLRIAIRRLLAAFELLRAARTDLPPVAPPLRRQLKILGDLRNAQLQRLRAERGPGAVPPRLRRHLLKRERRREEGATQTVESRKIVHRLKRWKVTTLSAHEHTPLRLQRLLKGKLRRAFDPLAAFAPLVPVDPAQRHEARERVREFRYLVEDLPPAWHQGTAMARLLTHLRSYQRTTGRIHDNELFLRRLERLVADKRLTVASIRGLRGQLISEKTRHLETCPACEQRLFRDAILARQALLKNLPCNSKTKSS